MIQTVVFDLDDTLFPEHQFVLSGFRAVNKEISRRFHTDDFYDCAKNLFSQGNRRTIFNLSLVQLGIQPEPSLIQELVKTYREHVPEIQLYEDARWAINFFHMTHKLAILTDGFLTTQRNKIGALGIASLFDYILYSDAFGRENWKPNDFPYRKIMESLDCPGERCIYIADNPEKDFVTARKLCWHTIRIRRESGEYSHVIAKPGFEADHQIDTLFELEGMIC